MVSEKIIPIILCGGSGTRLWPLSRESYPKQFVSLNPNSSKSLLQDTIERLQNLDNIQSPLIVCNEKHRFLVAEQMREIDIKPFSIILEPFGKDTAPAIITAAIKSLEKEKDPILLVASSDHVIKETEIFTNTLSSAVPHAEEGKLVTFGIIPSSPNTGFGYIKSETQFSRENPKGIKIVQFTEKPDLKKAKEFLKDKRYTWNSGIFMFKAKAILSEIDKFSPEVKKHCINALEKSKKDLDFERLNSDEFEKCQKIAIDFAVMEKTTKGVVLPLDVGWRDMGSWKAVWEDSKKDSKNNVINGNVINKNTEGCYLKSENRLIVGIGLKDLIVVETPDAILVSNKDEEQSIKSVVGELKEKNFSEVNSHKKIYRPWGHYISIEEGQRWQVKRIEVKPGSALSLQMHHHRSEHWIVVTGTALVQINRKKELVCENQSIYIPLGSKHRLSNPGKIPLVLIEVQTGDYLGENDIVRFEDKYGRINQNS